MYNRELAVSGGRFVRLAAFLFLAVFIAYWAIGLAGIYLKARKRHRPVSINLLFIEEGRQRFWDIKTFDPATRRLAASRLGLPPEVLSLPKFGYPAPGACAFWLFYLFPDPVVAYLGIVCGFAAGMTGIMLWATRTTANRLLWGTVLVLSLLLFYPLIFLLERANMEAMVWVVQALAILSFVKRRYQAAGLLVALAASMKGFPAILFLLFLPKKRFKELALSVPAVAVF